MTNVNSSENKWVTLPLTLNEEGKYDSMYVVGGYHSMDSGTAVWGTVDHNKIRLIGDWMGDIVITYENGTTNRIPLIFGYTLWYYRVWKLYKAPFDGAEKDEKMAELLKEALHLQGAYEGKETCVFKIKLRGEKVKTVEIETNKEKQGEPVIKGIYLASGDVSVLEGGEIPVNADDGFFDRYAVDPEDPYPCNVKDAIDKIRKALYTFEEDYTKETDAYEEDQTGVRVRFEGSNLAKIAKGVFYHNLKNLSERVDEEGLLHESAKGAPEYFDSFGTWKPNAGTFHGSYFTRNRSFTLLTAFGYKDLADRAVGYTNRKLMFFKENKLTLGGIQIPGHLTVKANNPLYYSEVLTQRGWSSVYTKEAFGEEYKNIGNQETDGHGLMMIGNYRVWKSIGRSLEWVEKNWVYINEACEWVLWCFEHPELSFAKDGLLFAESEGGMQRYTLYSNAPVFLGLLCYAEMADAVGKSDMAKTWRETADIIKKGIEDNILNHETKKWSGKIGFHHDPVLTMLTDVFGFDKDDIPLKDWLEYSYNVYPDNLKSVPVRDYRGAMGGLGYNHCIMTQNALLTDHMEDATKFIENLTKICYAPGKKNQYIAPEKFSYDEKNKLYMKHGDIGNLYQMVETLRCYHTVIGVSFNNEGVMKIFPRLPFGWDLKIEEMPVEATDATFALKVTYPKDGVQKAVLELSEENAVNMARFRSGPFPIDTKVCRVKVNGNDTEYTLTESGDSKWATFEFAPSKRTEIEVLYNLLGE